MVHNLPLEGLLDLVGITIAWDRTITDVEYRDYRMIKSETYLPTFFY